MNKQANKTTEKISSLHLHNLSPREAASRLGLSEQTLANWRTARKGPNYRKFGSAIRYSVADLEIFERSCTVAVSQ